MGKPIEVLVLDDEIIVGERLRDFLERKGIQVEVFTESIKALERLKEKSFDVIISDVKMKAPSGIDVLATVKKESYNSEVIVITGYSTVDTYRQAEYIGAFEFLAKPFQLSDIYKIVKKAAKKSRSRSLQKN
jgi:DNA-binding NtrC family response regulator